MLWRCQAHSLSNSSQPLQCLPRPKESTLEPHTLLCPLHPTQIYLQLNLHQFRLPSSTTFPSKPSKQSRVFPLLKESPHFLACRLGQLQHSISYLLETDLNWTEEDRHDANKRAKPAARREKRSRRTMPAHEHIRQLPKRYTAC